VSTRDFTAFERPRYLASIGIKTGTNVFSLPRPSRVCGHSTSQTIPPPRLPKGLWAMLILHSRGPVPAASTSINCSIPQHLDCSRLSCHTWHLHRSVWQDHWQKHPSGNWHVAALAQTIWGRSKLPGKSGSASWWVPRAKLGVVLSVKTNYK